MKNRAGSYKNVLIPSQALKENGVYLKQVIKTLKSQSLDPVEFVTLYFLVFLRIRHPKNWIQNHTRFEIQTSNQKNLLDIIPEIFELSSWEKEKLKHLSLQSFYQFHTFKGIPLAINKSMLMWLNGSWKIQLLNYIPTPKELLNLQVTNSRCVSIIDNEMEIDQLILSNRDPLSFLLHDLMHADQFFSNEESRIGQLGFYKKLLDTYQLPLLVHYLKNNNQFKKEFEYVASDMNAYVIHLLKCLKSAFQKIDPTEKLLFDVCENWNMNSTLVSAMRVLNTPDFSIEHELNLKNYFEKQAELTNA